MSRYPGKIYLCGFSGAGKTVSGRILSELIGYSFVDTDAIIESESGKSIPDIFAEDGENRFRQIEKDVIRSVSQKNKRIISLGGGALIDSDNHKFVKENGVLVYLQATLETINTRLRDSHLRPLLEYPDLGDEEINCIQRMETLFKQREKGYLRADLIIATDGKLPEEVAGEIKEKMSKDA